MFRKIEWFDRIQMPEAISLLTHRLCKRKENGFRIADSINYPHGEGQTEPEMQGFPRPRVSPTIPRQQWQFRGLGFRVQGLGFGFFLRPCLHRDAHMVEALPLQAAGCCGIALLAWSQTVLASSS